MYVYAPALVAAAPTGYGPIDSFWQDQFFSMGMLQAY